MTRLIDLSADEARAHFLKGSSYFNGDMPGYISFEPLLGEVASQLNGAGFAQHQKEQSWRFAQRQLQLCRQQGWEVCMEAV